MLGAMPDLLTTAGFQVGVVVALACAAALAVAGWRVPVLLVAPLTAVAGTLAGFAAERRWSWDLVIGLAALALGAEWSRPRAVVIRGCAAAPGAAIVALALPEPVPGWGGPALFAAVVGGSLVAEWFDAASPRLFTMCFALTALGVYSCVPDTEYARSLVGGMLGACALVVVPRLRSRPSAVTTLVGLCGYSAVAGGYARPSSVVGAIGCIGVIALLPVAMPGPGFTPTFGAAMLLLFLQGSVVLLSARWAGLRDATFPAMVIVALTWTVVIVALRDARRRGVVSGGAPPGRGKRR